MRDKGYEGELKEAGRMEQRTSQSLGKVKQKNRKFERNGKVDKR